MSEPKKPARARRRPVVSCEECRRRKVKCDRTHPCNHCRQLKAQCHYSEGIVPLNRQLTLLTSPRDIVGPPTPISVAPSSSSSHGDLSIAGLRNERPQHPVQRSAISPNTQEETEDSPKVRALLAKVQGLEQLLLKYMPEGVRENSTLPLLNWNSKPRFPNGVEHS
jgi:hypothetical protein